MPSGPSLFAGRLLLHRKRLGFNQKQLAERIGVHQSTISDWERGVSWPAIPELVALCQLFDVSAEYLTGRSDFPHGLAPDMWIADEEAIAFARANPRKKGIRCAFKVPRKMRVLEHREYEALKGELGFE